MEAAQEVTPNVHSLHVKLDWFPQPYPPNVHLIVDGKEGALIDAGFPDDQSTNARREMLAEFPGLNIRYIVITHHHFDHASGAHKLREETGARIVMHKDEAPLLERAHRVVITNADATRSLDSQRLAVDLISHGYPASRLTATPDPRKAVLEARQALAPRDLLCIAGSMYMAGVARETLLDDLSAQRLL